MKKIISFPTLALLIAITLSFSGCETTTILPPGDSSCDSSTTSLSSGHKINDNIIIGTGSKMFCICIPSGTSSLTIVLSDMTSDFDLYIGYGTVSSLQGEDYDWKSNNFGLSADSYTLHNPQAGCYYIQITDYNTEGGTFSLIATAN